MLDTSVIPHGYYCYNIEYLDYKLAIAPKKQLFKIFGHDESKVVPTIRTTSCPYWKQVSKTVYKCEFLNLEDADYNTLLWDQVKECQINIDTDE